MEQSVQGQVELAKTQIEQLKAEIQKVIVGQTEVVEQLIWCLIAGGHALLEGIPGLGKTMLVRTIADAIDLQFSRIQFTPDLMPADITGTTILDFSNQGISGQTFQHGPIFGNLVLADEINRATPKTQSALLEAMQEGTVTAGGTTHTLPKPFFVLATQNPIEQEGTYPLPEAQLDRFLLKIAIDYPTRDELKEIVRRTTGAVQNEACAVLTVEELRNILALAKHVLVSDDMLDAAVALIMHTHAHEAAAPQEVKQFVRYGAGPRAVQALIMISRVRALANGHVHISWSDIKEAAYPVLRHRLGLSYDAFAQAVTADHIIQAIVDSIEQQRK